MRTHPNIASPAKIQIRSAYLTAMVLLSGLFCTLALASDPPAVPNSAQSLPATRPAARTNPPPTLENVAYGDHPRQVFDFWKAVSAKPTPLLFYMHGGGWEAGDKRGVRNVEKYLDAGISVVSINYRYTTLAEEAHVKPPVEWPMHDAARALQFVRSKSSEWNIDKQRIGASGSSAGACTSLWLAFHNDLANSASNDPIARESTRLWCAAVENPQTSLDPQQMQEWTPNSRYGSHAFGLRDANNQSTGDALFAEFLRRRDEFLPWINEYSPIAHVSADDPSIYMIFSAAPALGQPAKDPTHTANFGVKLEEKLKSVGVECELVYPGAPGVKHASIEAYLTEKVKK